MKPTSSDFIDSCNIDSCNIDSCNSPNDPEAMPNESHLRRHEYLYFLAKPLPRLALVVFVLVKIIIRYQLFRFSSKANKIETIHEKSAMEIKDMCMRLRGGILKICQFISTRMDLLPGAYVVAFSELHDQVTSVESKKIIDTVEAKLNAPLDGIFESFETTPLAAASIAQVHRATLLTGEEVVVKIQVPGIKTIIAADLYLGKILSRIASKFLPMIDIVTIMEEIARSVSNELCYLNELNHLKRFRDYFKEDDRIVVPQVYEAYSTHEMIVMEYIEGENLSSFLNRNVDQRKPLFKNLCQCYMEQIYTLGHFQSDPNPGNFLVTPQGQIALLDLGSVYSIDRDVRSMYLQLTIAIATKDTKNQIRLLSELGFRTHSGRPDTLLMFSEFFRASSSRSSDPNKLLMDTIEQCRRDGIAKIPESYILLGKVIIALQGLSNQYKIPWVYDTKAYVTS